MKCEAFQLCVHRLRLVHSLGYCPRWTGRPHDAVVGYRRLDGKACGCRRGIGVYRIAVSQAAHLSRSGISGDGLPASGSRFACSSTHRSEVSDAYSFMDRSPPQRFGCMSAAHLICHALAAAYTAVDYALCLAGRDTLSLALYGLLSLHPFELLLFRSPPP